MHFDLTNAEVVVQFVAEALGIEDTSPEKYVAALVAEAASRPPREFVTETGRKLLPLLAAKHLLALGDYDIDHPDQIVPDTSGTLRYFAGARPTGSTQGKSGKGAHALTETNPRRPRTYGLRARIAAEASGYGKDRSIFNPDKDPIKDVAAFLWQEMNELLSASDVADVLGVRMTRLAAEAEEFNRRYFGSSQQSESPRASARAQTNYERPLEWQSRLNLLAEGVSLFRTNGPRALLLYGEQGMGKSWLAPEILAELAGSAKLAIVRCASSALYEQDLREAMHNTFDAAICRRQQFLEIELQLAQRGGIRPSSVSHRLT